jgi:hypothetical protein
MTAQIRSKALAIAAALAATTLAACGGGDSGSDSGGKAGSSADSRAAADKIIEQAIAANDKASSASIDATVDVTVKGVPRFKEPVQVTANGDYNLPEGADVPDFNVDVGLGLNGGTIGGGLVLADGKGFITLGDTGYPLPAKISEKIAKPAPAAKNGLTKTAAMFYINPQDWQKNAQLVGDARVAGEDTDHIKADIQPDKFFADIARLVNVLTALRVTQAVALPEHLTAPARDALVRSTTLAKGEVWIGKDDHVLRKATLQGAIKVAKKDQKVLGGVTGGTLKATVNVSEVGTKHTISAPKQRGSYSALQLSLDALGEFARREAGKK